MRYTENDINRFIDAQDSPYSGFKIALNEIQNGKKTSHWMWYIFPQFREFAHSQLAYYWGIIDKSEAIVYLSHPILGNRLRDITKALLTHKDKTALEIFGSIDAKKLNSCMTMFDYLSPNDIFGEVLDNFYSGKREERTLEILQRQYSV